MDNKEEKENPRAGKPAPMYKLRLRILIPLFLLGLAVGFYAGHAAKQKAEQEALAAVTELSGPMSEQELSELEQYPNLQALDLHGSDDTDAILAYEEEHPQVEVAYSVSADGVELENSVTELDWSGHDAAALAAEASHLRQLTEVELGCFSAAEAEAALRQIRLLQEAFPQARLTWRVGFGTKEYSNDTQTLDLSSLTEEDAPEAAGLLALLPQLSQITLPGAESETPLPFESYALLYRARPEADFTYTFSLFGQTVSTADTELKLKLVEIGNEGVEQLREVLSCLPKLTYFSTDRCGIDDEAMAQLRDEFPEKTIAWRVTMGIYSCMTDTEKFWAQGFLTDSISGPLKYCTKIRYLDLGHNRISDISFLAYMPDVEVLILAITNVTDISPLVFCPNLEYLELTLTDISDISVLSGMTKLRHLELSQMVNVTDITPIMGLDLERFHMMYNHGSVPEEQFEQFKELHPDCSTNFNNGWEEDPFVMSDWRISYQGGYTPRYQLLREQIGYDDPYGESKLYWFEDYPEAGSAE